MDSLIATRATTT